MSFRNLCSFTLLFLPLLLASCQSPDAKPPETTAEEQASEQDTPVPPTETAVAPEEPESPWAVVVQTQEEHLPAFAAFMNPEYGITSCSEGTTPNQYITSDGGNSWEPVRCLFRAIGIDGRTNDRPAQNFNAAKEDDQQRRSRPAQSADAGDDNRLLHRVHKPALATPLKPARNCSESAK